MTDPFEPIPAFNGKLNFKTDYNKSIQEIFAFFSAVVANPADYGVPDANRPYLQPVTQYIINLSKPDGQTFIATKSQNINAKLNPNTLLPVGPYPWLNKSEKYFILFDFLGYFFSLLGPAPSSPQPTDRNYYLPLACLYTRWGTKLAAANKLHVVTQVTWVPYNGKNYVFLGASIGGCSSEWQDTVRRERFAYIEASGVLKAPYGEFDRSPNRDENTAAGTRFGNCGESYPFLYILADPALRVSASGFAMRTEWIRKTAAYDANFAANTMWGQLIKPCDNCAYLIQEYGGTPENFAVPRS